jgi:hypothetical protein
MCLEHKPRQTKRIRAVIVFAISLFFSQSAMSADTHKRTLNGNMTEVYNQLPEDATSPLEIFTNGMVYGRIRINYFKYNWKEGSKYDPTGFAIGGSLIYKTAPFQGVSATVGIYTSQNLDMLKKDDARFGKAGKDTFSRYDVLEKGRWGMTEFAQAYLQCHFMKTDIKAGRQIFESFLTNSNDTKMIPNTFQGVSVTSNYIPNTTVKLAFFDKQKLRDHTRFHDIITYGDGGSSPWRKWRNNDDSAVHKGLSYDNLKAAGEDVDNKLLIAGITTQLFKKLTLDGWYNGVPDLFYSLMGEINYAMPLKNGWIVTPGFRLMRQFDDGAGDIGGAALSGVLAGMNGPAFGYDDANDVDSRLYGARLTLKKGPCKFLFGYTRISDDADLITPWRGLPTSGYTRSMAQYNWEAGARSWMLKGSCDLGKAGLVKGLRMALDYVRMEFDDTKERLGSSTKTDRYVLHLDTWYRFPFQQYLETKLRFSYVGADNLSNGDRASYYESRLEMNYLF